jgi:hypothetical protein
MRDQSILSQDSLPSIPSLVSHSSSLHPVDTSRDVYSIVASSLPGLQRGIGSTTGQPAGMLEAIGQWSDQRRFAEGSSSLI